MSAGESSTLPTFENMVEDNARKTGILDQLDALSGSAPLAVVLEYELEPDTTLLTLRTIITNETGTDEYGAVGDFISFGDSLQLFTRTFPELPPGPITAHLDFRARITSTKDEGVLEHVWTGRLRSKALSFTTDGLGAANAPAHAVDVDRGCVELDLTPGAQAAGLGDTGGTVEDLSIQTPGVVKERPVGAVRCTRLDRVAR